MAKITSVWIRIADSNGSEALRAFDLDLDNAVAPIKITSAQFYEKGEDGVSRQLETIVEPNTH